MVLRIAISICVVIAVIVLIVWRRRISAGQAMQLLGGVPANPAQSGLAWMFPGRGTPPDADIRKTSQSFVDKRPPAPLPPGIKRTEDPR